MDWLYPTQCACAHDMSNRLIVSIIKSELGNEIGFLIVVFWSLGPVSLGLRQILNFIGGVTISTRAVAGLWHNNASVMILSFKIWAYRPIGPKA